MRLTRTILRVIFFLVAVSLIVYLNRKSEDNTRSIVAFKFEMLKKMSADTLGTKEKAELLVDETTKFVDGSSQVKNGINYLMILGIVVVISELAFVVIMKRNLPLNQ